MSTPAFYWGTGRRKTAVARVRLIPGEGQMVINGRTPEEHFGGILGEAELFLPFRVTGTEGRYNTLIKVEGGGTTGQSGAIRHGIARALAAVRPGVVPAPAAPGRPPHPRPADEGAEEVRPEARPQGPAVHEAVVAPAAAAALPAAGVALTHSGCARRVLARLAPGAPSRRTMRWRDAPGHRPVSR